MKFAEIKNVVYDFIGKGSACHRFNQLFFRDRCACINVPDLCNKYSCTQNYVISFSVLQVQSKIMYNNDHPDWNQILKIGIQFPSMCERLKFIVRDWYVPKVFQLYVKLNLDDRILFNFSLWMFLALNMLFVTSFLCSYMNSIMIYSGIHVYDIIEWSQKTKSSPNISWLIDHSIKLRLHDIS